MGASDRGSGSRKLIVRAVAAAPLVQLPDKSPPSRQREQVQGGRRGEKER